VDFKVCTRIAETLSSFDICVLLIESPMCTCITTVWLLLSWAEKDMNTYLELTNIITVPACRSAASQGG
jgi:hypothetical protein